MTTKTEALTLALEALEEAHYVAERYQDETKRAQAITAVNEALQGSQDTCSLAQPEPLFVKLIAHHEGLAEELAQTVINTEAKMKEKNT